MSASPACIPVSAAVSLRDPASVWRAAHQLLASRADAAELFARALALLEPETANDPHRLR
ncbi:MAG: hypothetical protein VBE63_01195 [Lamprobacter sp.]|uniref:hypothetical protein n=1 Tax=Lamprobacter sp. TaxID=3100796 RepID=UPI002B25FDE4|nr:hypothetical protein [Lamprobacter sp.]MEA3638542.1 hypothetical protein [Lamprobacter sp.]